MHFSICATDGDDTVKNLLSHMKEFNPFSELEMNVFRSLFLDYNILGGMPAVVAEYIERNTFEGSLDTQMQLIADYKEDIRRYAPESIKQELSTCSTGSRRSLQGKTKNSRFPRWHPAQDSGIIEDARSGFRMQVWSTSVTVWSFRYYHWEVITSPTHSSCILRIWVFWYPCWMMNRRRI